MLEPPPPGAWDGRDTGQSIWTGHGRSGLAVWKISVLALVAMIIMPAHIELILTADYPARTAGFRLLDARGSQLARRHTDFKTIPAGYQQGIFDLRNYLRHYVDPGGEGPAVAAIGVCIAEKVMGREIFELLWKSRTRRTLTIRLPNASEQENPLAAALACVPWEIARPTADQQTLAERNVLVRIVHGCERLHVSQPPGPASDEDLRVLFVSAETRGSRPLDTRKEHRQLRELFEREISPRRRVIAHFLSHGVTRERLEAQVRENAGYHIIHWSGHGHRNILELARPSGARNRISGAELLAILDQPGAVSPKLVFLSACHSGDISTVKVWDDFLAIASGSETTGRGAEKKRFKLGEPRGFAGTAHALLRGNVPSVLAMRYAVSDEYACELSVEFYRLLLTATQSLNVGSAFTLARQTLLRKHEPGRFSACDHLTPVLYGAERPGLRLAMGRSLGLDQRDPRLHAIAELATTQHEHFVGRTWELARLGAEFIGSSTGTEVRPIAVITGLGGMGKTALAAEALAIWETRFGWVLLYQAKPGPLGFETVLRDTHLRLMGELGRYHDHVRGRPDDAIFREEETGFMGAQRLERLTINLLRAMQDEPILLVLDNFENNLKEHVEPSFAGKQPAWACRDPAWDHCLSSLAKGLAGSVSRVLITCRKPFAALTGKGVCRIVLGPLPAGEAALFLRSHAVLRQMAFGGDPGEKTLSLRLLRASCFHPLLMDRFARLAAPALRARLMQALDAVEAISHFARLPALFTDDHVHAKESAYLEGALVVSLDELIAECAEDTRCLLWVIALANEPVGFRLLESVWSEAARVNQDIRPLLAHLISLGLVTEQPVAHPNLDLLGDRDADGDIGAPSYGCHELVRERILAWLNSHSPCQDKPTTNVIHFTYAEKFADRFRRLQGRNMAHALESGISALAYYAQAGDWPRLASFADDVVTCTRDPRLLNGVVPRLQAAAEVAPEAMVRWNCMLSLANTLRNTGRPDQSLPVYARAEHLARSVATSGGTGSREAWTDVARTCSGWAVALRRTGNHEAAREGYLRAMEASEKAQRPAIFKVSYELELLRLELIKGRVSEVECAIESRLMLLESWWNKHLSGERIPEAPDPDFLARAYIGALDVASVANKERDDAESAVRHIDETLRVRRRLNHSPFEMAIDRFNRANTIVEIPGRAAEAKADLEECITIFKDRPDWMVKVLCSLAEVLAKVDDAAGAVVQQRRALAIAESLPDPSDRGFSHLSLGRYLAKLQTEANHTEAMRHSVAALVYFHVAGVESRIKSVLIDFAVYFHRAHIAAGNLVVPCVSELLGHLAFHSLKEWLQQKQTDLERLQISLDSYLEQARQAEIEHR